MICNGVEKGRSIWAFVVQFNNAKSEAKEKEKKNNESFLVCENVSFI